MAIATITDTGAWQTVTTTTEDTVFQNQTSREVYLLSGTVGATPIKEGFLLAPWVGSIVIKTGMLVSAASLGGTAKILYMGV